MSRRVPLLAFFALAMALILSCGLPTESADNPTPAVGTSSAAAAAAPATASTAIAPDRPVTASAGKRPNVVLFLTDDMRPDEMRFLPKTQAWLRKRGVKFTDARSPHPLCCPARTSLLTGEFAQNNGVKSNQGPMGGFKALIEPDNNIGVWMQQQGYRTSFFGKFLNGYKQMSQENGGEYPTVAGWDKWDPLVRFVYGYRKGTFYNGDRFKGEYITNVMNQRIRRELRRAGDQPFFMWVNHTAPHNAQPKAGSRWQDKAVEGTGWLPPLYEDKYAKEYRTMVPKVLKSPAFNEADVSDLPANMYGEKTTRKHVLEWARARARALRSVDDSVMKTIDRLRENGQLKNTYLVFASDNSYQLGEHRYLGKNLMFDASIQVPLFVSAPNRKASVDDTPVTLLDVTASALDWTGATPGRPQDGMVLRDAGDRDTILIQSGSRGNVEGDYWAYRGVQTDRYLYAQSVPEGEGVLFDRETDPHQLTNHFGDKGYQQVQRELADRAEKLASCSGSDCNRSFGPVPSPGR